MISVIVIIVYSLALVAASFFYLNARYHPCGDAGLKDAARKNIAYLILTAAVFVGLVAMEAVYALEQGAYSLLVLLKWSALFWGAYLLAKVDYHEKKIPNKIILALLILRAAFLLYEVCVSSEYWVRSLVYPFLGAAIGGGIMAAAMVISRKGVGMGDVKMFIVIGAFVGSTEILETMLCIFFISALGGILLLITRKAGLKDSIPMAPFACAGIALKFLLLMMGGLAR